MNRPLDVRSATATARLAETHDLEHLAQQNVTAWSRSSTHPLRPVEGSKAWASGPDGSWSAGGAAGVAFNAAAAEAGSSAANPRDRGPMALLMTTMKVISTALEQGHRYRDQRGATTPGGTVAGDAMERSGEPVHPGGGLDDLFGWTGISDTSQSGGTPVVYRGADTPAQAEDPALRLALEVATRLMEVFEISAGQACGAVGSLFYSSRGLDPRGGWARWSGMRRGDFLRFSRERGFDPDGIAANWEFLRYELEGTRRGVIDALRRVAEPEQAAVVFRRHYEQVSHVADRARGQAAVMIHEALMRRRAIG